MTTLGPPRTSHSSARAAELSADLLTLLRLPASVQRDFGELLAHNLAAEVGEAADAHVGDFCRTHGVDALTLVPAVRAARTLFREAAAADRGVAEVVAEIEALCPGEGSLVQILAACYGRALPGLRVELVLGALGEFGLVLETIGLRLDCVPVSRHTPEAMVPIPLLTLHYREVGELKRLTVQLPPQVLATLRYALDALVK